MALTLLQIRSVAGSTNYSNRVQSAMAIAAGQVFSEAYLSNTIAQSNSGTRTLSFGSIPGWVTPGTSISDLTAISVIPSSAVVTGTATAGGTVTITISTPLFGTVASGDTISFPAHLTRARFANQVAAGNYNILEAALISLSNLTLTAEGIDDGSALNGIPDTDLQFSINSFWNILSGAGL